MKEINDKQLTSLFKRYIAQTLGELEYSHHTEHNKIVKAKLWCLKRDLMNMLGVEDETN